MTATRGSAGVARRQNGDPASSVFDIEPPSGGRRRIRIPEIALGLLLIAACALTALWWQARVSPTISVLVAASPIERGDVLQASHLGVVELETQEAVSVIDAASYDAYLDKISLADIGQGAILDPTMFAEAIDVDDDEAVLGLFLDPDQVPTLSLRAGSFVDVVATDEIDAASASGSIAVEDGSELNTSPDETPAILATGARVLKAEPGTGFGQLHVSLVLDRAEAVSVAIAAAEGHVVLLEVRSGETS